ncbi:MAG TPA: UbiD family decarboxylase [Solirubrobacteraceae bacterium]|nr:UbiD family decarboxylase [Solirubrobacteraceae bacterium]
MSPTDQSLRAVLAQLEDAGELIRIPEPVSLHYELSALLAAADDGPALLFERVVGGDMPVVGGVLASRARIANGLGVGVDGIQERMLRGLAEPLAPRPAAEAPCQEIQVETPDLGALPIPWFFEHETGPYVTAGAIVARDGAEGPANLSIARLKPLGANRALVGIAPNHHLAQLGRRAAVRGESLPIAVTIGNHPAVLLAACLYLDLGTDELEHAGGLLGAPVEVALTADGLAVPAHCELVLEGRLDYGELVEEGPVSEFHGMYEDYGPGAVASFSRLTMRRDAIYQAIEPGRHAEHLLLGGTAIAAGLEAQLRRVVPAVRAVAVPEGGAGRLTAVVALDPDARPGSAQRVMFAVWAAVSLIRTVTVVDADVAPWDHVEVEWARTAFARPDRDLLVVPGGAADRAEPLELRGRVAKLGIDATRKEADRSDHRVAAPPAEAVAAARRRLADPR